MTYLRMLIISLIVIPSATNATGNTLLKQCSDLISMIETRKDPHNPFDVGTCSGYLKGIRETNELHRIFAKELGVEPSTLLFCTPNEVSVEQLARIVVKFLKENPEQLHAHEMHLAWEALYKAFPCK